MQLRAKEVEAAAVAARVKDLEAELAAADEKAAGLVQQAETAAAQAQGEAGGLRAEAERQLAEARYCILRKGWVRSRGKRFTTLSWLCGALLSLARLARQGMSEFLQNIRQDFQSSREDLCG